MMMMPIMIAAMTVAVLVEMIDGDDAEAVAEAQVAKIGGLVPTS